MDTSDQFEHTKTNGFSNGRIDSDERELEELLFGNLNETWDKTGHELSEPESGSGDEEEDDQANEGQDDLFFFDAGASFVMDSKPAPQLKTEDAAMEDAFSEKGEVHESDEEKEDEDDDDIGTLEYEYNRKPAWVDDDDARVQISLASTNRLRKMRKNEDEDIVSGVVYEKRLRRQFSKMYPKPDWAILPSEKRSEKRKRRGSVLLSSDESDGEFDATIDSDLGHEERIELLQSTYGILDQRRHAKLLPSDVLDIMRQKNANQMAPTNDTLTTVSFHPNAHVLLAGSADKNLQLFQIDGKENPKIQSIRFKDMKPLTAQWNPSGDKIYAAGMRKFYYVYDVQSGVVDRCHSVFDDQETALRDFCISPCGQYIAFTLQGGHIGLASTLTKEWVGDLKMNGSVDSVTWSSNSQYIYGAGSAGTIYQFDVGQRECVKQWEDDGAVNNACIQMSPNDQYLATGSSSGYVNLYNRKGLLSETNPKPFKSFGHLTTRANIIKFNHDSQIMAIASATKNKELKMVHLPSGKVFPNWPTERSPIKRVQDLDFSPNSDYMAIALHNGRCLLYSLKHYAL